MITENILKGINKEELTALLHQKQYDDFFKALEPLSQSGELESSVLEIREEWRKLQIAKRNGLMDDDQVQLAIIAFFRRTAHRMTELMEQS